MLMECPLSLQVEITLFTKWSKQTTHRPLESFSMKATFRASDVVIHEQR